MQFISFTDDNAGATQPNVQVKEQERPQTSGLPANLHLLNELKTKRLNLVLQPTIYKLAQEKAKATGQSTNNFIINAIIDALED